MTHMSTEMMSLTEKCCEMLTSTEGGVSEGNKNLLEKTAALVAFFL